MKGRRTPTQIKIAQGTDQKCRLIPNEMKPKKIRGLPIPPITVQQTPGADIIWYQKVKELKSLGVLSVLDVDDLTIYCCEMAIYYGCMNVLNSDPEGRYYETGTGVRKLKPEVTDAREALDRALKISGRFGFNPADRGKISMPPKDDNSILHD
jgi:P27 family predicted phage terminase small subunit